MSRTYRLRHLPPLSARKYIDARPSKFSDLFDELVDQKLREMYPSAFKPSGYIYLVFWPIRRAISDQLSRDFIAPIGTTGGHPWVPWWSICPTKSWYKKVGNRRVRRHNRDVVHRFAHLGDDVDQKHRFFNKKDGWNKRSLY